MPVNKPERPPVLDTADRALVDGVLARRLRPLAKAITLIESQREDHQARARAFRHLERRQARRAQRTQPGADLAAAEHERGAPAVTFEDECGDRVARLHDRLPLDRVAR